MDQRTGHGQSGFAGVQTLAVLLLVGTVIAIVVYAAGIVHIDAAKPTCADGVRSIQIAAQAVHDKTGGYPIDQQGLMASTTFPTTSGGLATWPGSNLTALPGQITTTGKFAFTYSGTASTYRIGVLGRSLPGVALTESSPAIVVKYACTPI